MKNQNILFNSISEAFSSPRMNAYLNHPKCQNKLDALSAYYWNIQLSQSFYPILQSLEVALRNAIHRSAQNIFHSEYWFEHEFLHPKEQEPIKHVKASLKRQKKLISADRIIAELQFGFWTSLFDVRYEHQQTLWPQLLPKIFQHIPRKYRTRKYLSKQLNCIRKLKNRIFHYEPIWYWKNLSQQHQIALNLLKWLSPAAYEHTSLLDNFNLIYTKGFFENTNLLHQTFNSHSETSNHVKTKI